MSTAALFFIALGLALFEASEDNVRGSTIAAHFGTSKHG